MLRITQLTIVSFCTLASVDKPHKGIASRLINTARQSGTICGTAMLGGIYLANESAPQCAIAIGIAAVALIFGSLLSTATR
ncbi:hypothetical protein [Corynebacterium sp. sy039]|uniref:hypothetical protein n=1 Tax=Corynebacterium sp. sy039 TaxID=2599641 RepID=UPI0011B8047B|nr:hypothetical protein [Corynebacterium sp. sy039]QDZ43073.1 hypothetical protein FQV43_07780 [Corynebacterium sp. sy039]